MSLPVLLQNEVAITKQAKATAKHSNNSNEWGATTFSITTLSIMTFSITTLSITTFSITTLSIMTFSITTLSTATFSRTTLSRKGLFGHSA